MLMIPSYRSQLDSHAQKAALRREAKVHAAAAAARESSRMEWQLEHMDDQWDVPEINSKLGVSFAHYEYEEAFERLREYIEDGKLSMDSEHYAQWRHEYEQKRKKKMGDAYVFERTDTDDDHKYEPENDEDDDEDDDADDY
jgi:anti-sigma28 factor (negative regulator of flagellin synthesis)